MQLSQVIKYMNISNPARGAGSFLDEQGKAFSNKTEKKKRARKYFRCLFGKKGLNIFRLQENDKYLQFNKEFFRGFLYKRRNITKNKKIFITFVLEEKRSLNEI